MITHPRRVAHAHQLITLYGDRIRGFSVRGHHGHRGYTYTLWARLDGGISTCISTFYSWQDLLAATPTKYHAELSR